MKSLKSLLTLTLCLFVMSGFAFNVTMNTNMSALLASEDQTRHMTEMLGKLTPDEFVKMSPAQLEGLAGHKLSFKEKIALKVVKMKAKKMAKAFDNGTISAADGAKGAGIDKGVYILLAILIPFLAVGLASDWNGSDWLICLLLTCLCWLPGFIYALIKMKNYY
jgi:uncharacterized membrane protein YqaE (UPF0057 family)